MKITLTNLKKINTLEQLKELDMGSPIYDIGGRGGNLGFIGINVANRIGVLSNYLPRNFGVHCNYLGGGVRGSLIPSDFDIKIVGRKRQLLEALGEACKRVYLNLEGGSGLNDEYDEYSGEPNWEAIATNTARKNGTTSAY